MGWASGSSLLEEVAKIVMPKIAAPDRPKVAKKLIEIFEREDCDTINEVDQADIRREYDKKYPPDDGDHGD